MAERPKEYRRLPGARNWLVVKVTLWLGRDHLLLVSSHRFSEDYRRFYFRDIQAILLRRTRHRQVWTWALSAVGAGVLLGMTAFGASAFSLAVTGGAWLLALLANWLRGPTCACHIQTAVQTEPLPSLHHLRNADRVIRRLRPRVDAAQGPLDPSWRTAAGVVSAADPVPVPPRPAPSVPFDGRSHARLYLTLGLGALHTAVGFLGNWRQHPAHQVSGGLLALATIACVLVATVKQFRSDISRPLRATIWVALAYIGCIYLTALGYSLLRTVERVSSAAAQGAPIGLTGFYTTGLPDSPALHAFLLICPLLISLWGLLALYQFRRRSAGLNRWPDPSGTGGDT